MSDNNFNNFKKDKGPNNNGNKPQNAIKNLAIWAMLIFSAVIFYSIFESDFSNETRISYSEYQRVLNAGLIESAVVEKSQLNNYEFHGILKREEIVTTPRGDMAVIKFVTKLGFVDGSIEETWTAQKVDFKYKDGDASLLNILLSILPWIFIFGLFIFFLTRMQQGGGSGGKNLFSFGKSRAKMMDEKDKRVTFIDVAGAEEAKNELEEIVEFLKMPEKFTALGAKIPQGVLLVGPPGTGKTLLGRAVAGEAGVPFFSISGADFVEMFVGVGASRVRDLFEKAKTNRPAIIFIDEIDAVGRRRGAGLGGGHDEREQTLNQLLVEMDGFEQNSGVIIIAATNRADVLDPALLRPGRFDRQVVVDLPDAKGREAIFKVHSKNVPLAEDVNFDLMAKGSPGLSGADIANITNESALNAAKRNSTKVTMMDFEQARDKVLMGVERKSMVISPKEKEITAYHEMGHALAGLLLKHADTVHKVTIIPRGRALGLTWNLPDEAHHSKSKEYFEDTLVVLMAGKAAEKMIFNIASTGASNDLERASAIARKMVCNWGMSDVMGPVTFANQKEDVFLGHDISQPKDHSELTQQEIDKEVRRILTNAMQRAEQLLTDNIDHLHNISKILIERELLDGEELEILLKGEELPPISKQKMTALRNIGDNSTEATEKSA
jgi:cell division protease FtsH